MDEFQRLFERYSKQARTLFGKAIMQHFEQMLLAAQMNGFRNIEEVITRVDSAVLRKAFIKVYDTIGRRMAKKTYRELLSQKSVFPGTVDEAWTNALNSIVLYETIPSNGIILTTSQRIFKEFVDDALMQGLPMEDIVKGLRAKFKEVLPWRAWNIARTEVLSAMNYGAEIGAEQTGLNIKKTWLAYIDKATRASHKAVHGTSAGSDGLFVVERTNEIGVDYMRFPGDPKASAGNRINCYLPGNFIESNIIEGQRSFYSGKAIEIVTRRGERLTVTPNHRILATYGFIAAKDLKIGDNLVCNSVSKYRFIRLINHYIKQKIFRVENIFSALEILWRSKYSVVTALDFDGDGQSLNGNVKIVNPKIKLMKRRKSALGNLIDKIRFNDAGFKSTQISGFGALNLFGSAYNSTTTRVMSLLYLTLSMCFGHKRPFNGFSLGRASKLNAFRDKVSGHAMTGDSKFLRELINTNSRNITFDDVINIREIDFSGHVYDFSSFNGVNIVNNIYTSNCRCTLTREVI